MNAFIKQQIKMLIYKTVPKNEYGRAMVEQET